MDQLWDDKALARKLGVTMRTLRSWRYEGRDMPPGAKVGGSWRYRESDVEAWFDAKLQAQDVVGDADRLLEDRPGSSQRHSNRESDVEAWFDAKRQAQDGGR